MSLTCLMYSFILGWKICNQEKNYNIAEGSIHRQKGCLVPQSEKGQKRNLERSLKV